jgi:hypothetical protein
MNVEKFEGQEFQQAAITDNLKLKIGRDMAVTLNILDNRS